MPILRTASVSLIALICMAQGAAPTATPPADDPAVAAYKSAMSTMMQKMEIPYTGNPDQDFVRGMLPHHEGAVAMARVELQYGHDPELQQLAQEIVESQSKEVMLMQHWQLQHPAPH